MCVLAVIWVFLARVDRFWCETCWSLIDCDGAAEYASRILEISEDDTSSNNAVLSFELLKNVGWFNWNPTVSVSYKVFNSSSTWILIWVLNSILVNFFKRVEFFSCSRSALHLSYLGTNFAVFFDFDRVAFTFCRRWRCSSGIEFSLVESRLSWELSDLDAADNSSCGSLREIADGKDVLSGSWDVLDLWWRVLLVRAIPTFFEVICLGACCLSPWVNSVRFLLRLGRVRVRVRVIFVRVVNGTVVIALVDVLRRWRGL